MSADCAELPARIAREKLALRSSVATAWLGLAVAWLLMALPISFKPSQAEPFEVAWLRAAMAG